jgi:hypothetical protein
MHGLVNQSFRDMIVEKYGLDAWHKIQVLSGVEQEMFISNISYEDNLTYELIGAAVEVANSSVNELLEEFGVYWVLNTGVKKYGELMKAGGSDFSSFARNLPRFHDRIIMIYPDMKPPEFKIQEVDKGLFVLDYFSERQGLTYFVIGLMKGVAIMHSESIRIELIKSEFATYYHDTFHISLVN